MKTLEELAREYQKAEKYDEAMWLAAGTFFEECGLLLDISKILMRMALRIVSLISSPEEIEKMLKEAISEATQHNLKKQGRNN